MPRKTFHGHGIGAIVVNITVAILGPYIDLSICSSIFSTIIFFKIIGIIYIPILLYALAEPTYLCYEIKHLLLRDGIADDRKPSAIVGFSLMSIFGYCLSLVGIHITASYMPFYQEYKLPILGSLCFLSAFGAAIGLVDGFGHEMFIRPLKIINFAFRIIRSKLILVVIIMTLLLLIGSLSVINARDF